ncbi:MAG TPA: hypothetical protein DDY78_26310 [Planctomycetales bacterium]|jgi:adenylate cyclase|nr:hypothetical protein [Planctomycetales bacterium]
MREIDFLTIRILEGDRAAFDGRLTGPLELGRQQAGEPAPYAVLPGVDSAPARLVVARQDDRDNISRRHALLEPLSSGRVRLTNRSKAPLPCGGAPGGVLAPGANVELAAPFSFSLPGRTVTVGAADSDDQAGMHSLEEQTVGPGRIADLSVRLRSLPGLSGAQLNEMVGWLQTTMGVLQATVGAADFLDKAAEALVQIVGLELGRVLLLDGEQWVAAAAYGEAPTLGRPWQPSRRVLAEVRQKKKTFWQSARPSGEADTPSLAPLQTVVAAPLLDADGNVVGALYGERRRAPISLLNVGGQLEATLVDLLACGVAAGLARQAKEKSALEAHVRLEQFFGADLARRLVREPALLEGRDAGVTLLFCDVRGFSRVSEKLGPAGSLRWMNDVMNELSRCVLDEGGVLVDYVGDEVLAMWGAPQDQPDQAERAVRAALAMLAALPALNTRWQEVLGGATAVGVGVSTGPAQVGNTGSKYKFKYGAMGNTVNLGSRVQGLTQYLKCPVLVTRGTRERLGDGFTSRRVVKARVVNIAEPVDLYEVEAAGVERRRQFFAESEAALEALEAGDFALAAHRAGMLLLDHRGDGPLLLTLSRASTALVEDGRGFDAVWAPPGK